MEQQRVDGVAGLKKHDIKVSGVVFMLYCLVAAGAFGIEEMVPESGPGMTLILLVAFPIFWAYPISNMVAECGSLLPSEGGLYVWSREAFGEFWGFQVGWWTTVSTYIANGTYVTLVAGYVSQLIPMSDFAILVLKTGMIVIFTVINLMGVKEVEKVSTVLSVLVIMAFALVAIVGLINWETNPMDPVMPPDANIFDSVSGGISICVWMYCGYECISNMAGEVKNPQVIPKGLLIAMPLVALTYVLPTLGGLASMPAGSWENWALSEEGLGGNSVGYATILSTHLGNVWGYVFLVIAIISQCAIFNTYLASGSRGFFVLADDNLCPKVMVKVSKKRGVPWVGILSLAVVTFILGQNFDFSMLVNIEVVFMLAYYLVLAFAVMKLRKKYPVEDRIKQNLYVIRGGKPGFLFCTVMPIIVAVIALLLNGTDYLFVGLSATLTGLIAYVILKKIYGGLYKSNPEDNPINKKTGLAFGDSLRIGVLLFIVGAFAFVGKIWLKWYEVDYGGWGPEDYDMFNNSIPQLMQALQWGGLALMVIGVILAIVAKKIERDENKC